MVYTVVLTKYQKYPSTKILKHANILAKVNKFPYGRLLNRTPYDAYSITIRVFTMTLAETSNKKKEKIFNNSTMSKPSCAI